MGPQVRSVIKRNGGAVAGGQLGPHGRDALGAAAGAVAVRGGAPIDGGGRVGLGVGQRLCVCVAAVGALDAVELSEALLFQRDNDARGGRNDAAVADRHRNSKRSSASVGTFVRRNNSVVLLCQQPPHLFHARRPVAAVAIDGGVDIAEFVGGMKGVKGNEALTLEVVGGEGRRCCWCRWLAGSGGCSSCRSIGRCLRLVFLC